MLGQLDQATTALQLGESYRVSVRNQGAGDVLIFLSTLAGNLGIDVDDLIVTAVLGGLVIQVSDS